MGINRLSGIDPGQTIFITEGEGDSWVVEQNLGHISLSPTNGKESFDPEWIKLLHGHHVILLWDCDGEGRDAVSQKVLPAFRTPVRNGDIPSVKVVWLFDDPNNKDMKDATDYFAKAGGTAQQLLKMIENQKPLSDEDFDNASEPNDDIEEDEWKISKQFFPRPSDFPWDVLPPSIANSLQQLGRSHATSPISIPGAAIVILASVLGTCISISPKKSWEEPLIFWIGDNRPSGAGKTSSARALFGPLYKAQKMANEEYLKKCEEEQAKKPKDRQPVKRARGYFVTDLTIEGLRNDISSNGGIVAILDELSSFISAQNQYKSKGGSDREAWLCLHDGKPARIVRAKETYYINGARVSLFGGIQPKIWQQCFGGDDGVYLDDGTIYRFLVTYEGEKYFPLTNESWDDHNRLAWEETLINAMNWADRRSTLEDSSRFTMKLDREAREYFFKWRNDLHKSKLEFPEQIKGFIPKINGYALRLTGILHCFDRFSNGLYPEERLSLSEIQKGIALVSFYMSHIIDATKALFNSSATPSETDIVTIHLAKTLESLRNDVDSGKLAIGHIFDKYNEGCDPVLKMSSPRSIGALIRRCGLNIAPGKHDANGKRRVICLAWDKETQDFINKSLQSLQSLQTDQKQTVRGGDKPKRKSPKSSPSEKTSSSMETRETSNNQTLHNEAPMDKGFGDNGDIGDNPITENDKKCNESTEWEEVTI